MRHPSYRSHYPALILISLLGLNLVPPQPTEAQKRGYRIVGNQIIVNSPAHWERWSMPGHAVDILPSGGVQPHFSRSRFNVLDDLGTYTRRLLDFRRKKNQTAVLNIDSTETLDVFGNIIRDRKKNPLYTYLSRIGISRVGSNPEGGGQHSGRRPQHLLGTRLQRPHRGLVGRGGPRPEPARRRVGLKFCR